TTRRAAGRASTSPATHRPGVLGGALAALVAMGRCDRDRQAGDGDRLAPPGLQGVLGVEVQACGTTGADRHGRGVDRVIRSLFVETSSRVHPSAACVASSRSYRSFAAF